MIPKIKKNIESNLSAIILSLIVIAALSVFCQLMGYSLMIPILLVFLGLHLHFFKKASTRNFLQLGLLLTILIFTTYSVIHYFHLPAFYIPVAGIVMLTILLFNDLQVSFIMAFAASVIVSLIVKGDFGMMITFFIGGLTGAYLVRDARTRGQLIAAGCFISLMHIICFLFLNQDIMVIFNRELTDGQIYPLLANGLISAFLVAATLKIFENLFGALTNYSLLELSDFNQPLLKRMVLEAPGTYHHSLLVSNLAEAAADVIGANALLTRVGAYYHDIGKLVKAEYFTENQLVGGNKHDDMEPSMSRLVILNHVKEGMELGRKYRLNSRIIDFIPQHHGTSLMHFFYQKALEDTKEGEVINEDDYRYPGPKPQTRETAITMLADSVEGATRTIDDPTPVKIEEMVKKVINNKFIDGQLDECNLTLREINKISATFIRVLSAMHHGRVKYPEKKNGNHHQKSSEKNGHSPANDQKNGSSHSSA